MRFEVLGPVRAVRDGRVLGPISELRRRLLAVLLVRANRPVTTEVLAEALWARGSSRNAPLRPGNSMYIHVHRLRQVLDRPERLQGVAGGYLLEVGPDELDADLFGRLHADAREAAAGGDLDRAVARFREALALWRDAPYADVDESHVVAPEAKRLAESRLVAYEELFDAELARGRARELVPELTELVNQYPLRERFAGQQMLALYRSGRRTRAEAAYRGVRQRLARELNAEPGRELRELYEAVRSEDPKLDPAPDPGPDRHVPVRPGQLPPAPGAFFGREPELAELERVASGLVLLTGMAGIGKTGLAVRYAHQIAGRFEDGQLYLDLGGHSRGPALDPLAALGQLMRRLGADPSRAWESVADATAEYRSLLSGRKLLVLLDNAASADQVRPLLPGTPGSLTLVTSRNRLSGLIAHEGAHRIGLGELAPDAAYALLAQLLGEERLANEPGQAAALIDACAGLPLALRIAAAQLADQPHRTLADYVADLNEHGLATLTLDDDHSAVAAAFDLSYEHLVPKAQRLFRLLGLVPGKDVTLEAAAAMSGTTVADARTTVRALANAHLLEEHAAGRYRLHDLLDDYAQQRAEAEEPEPARAEALNRLYSWYYLGKQAATSHRASTRRHPPPPVLPDGLPEIAFDDGRGAMEWLRGEFPNLAAAIQAAAERPEQAHWAWQLAVGLLVAMAEHGYLTDVLVVGEIAVATARRSGDRHALANVLIELEAGRHRADLPIDTDLVAEALEHAEYVGDRPLLAYCLNFAAIAHKTCGDLDVAEQYLMRSLDIHRDDGDKRGQARALDNLGLIAYQRGDLRRAEQRYEQILELAGDQPSRLTAMALPSLVWARVMLGRVDGIDELIERAEDAVTRYGHPIKAHVLRLYRTIWYRDTGRYDDALDQALAAVRSAEELDQPLARSDAHYQLGLCRLGQGDLDAARVNFERAFELADSAQVAACLSPPVRGLAETELAANRPGVAESQAVRALAFAEKWSWNPVQLAGALVTLARTELALGRPADAIAHGEQALAIHRETGHFLGRARAHRILGEASQAVDAGEGAGHLREALRMFEAFGSPEANEVRTTLGE